MQQYFQTNDQLFFFKNIKKKMEIKNHELC